MHERVWCHQSMIRKKNRGGEAQKKADEDLRSDFLKAWGGEEKKRKDGLVYLWSEEKKGRIKEESSQKGGKEKESCIPGKKVFVGTGEQEII